MEVAQAHTVPGKRVEARSADFAAVAAQVAVTQVIGDNYQEVRALVCGHGCGAANGNHQGKRQMGHPAHTRGSSVVIIG
ncbi:hypothetical protein D9M71_574150 [compost metagenome]